MAGTINFTKRTIESIPAAPKGKRENYADQKVRGLTLRVTDKATKTFYFRRKHSGQLKVSKIGRFPDVSVEHARDRATTLCGQRDDHDASPAVRLTLGHVFDLYLEYSRSSCSSWKHVEGYFRRYFADWRGLELGQITKARAHLRICELHKRYGAWTANRVLTDARAAINRAIKLELVPDYNPFRGIPKYRAEFRDRYLTPEELPPFFAALSRCKNKTFRDFILICLLTGARRGNVLTMKWEQLDFHLQTWRIPVTKNGSPQLIPLTSRALALLVRRSESKQSKWVFPGDGITGHFTEPKRAWKNLLADAGISDLRIHDLRRTLGSYMAMGNSSLSIIGAALGHRSASSTQIYARLAHTPIRTAVESAQDEIYLLSDFLTEPPMTNLAQRNKRIQ